MYFAKYLPVEGEITTNTFVQLKPRFKETCVFKLEGIYKGGKTGVSNWCKFPLKNLEVVKLFLCSRDIQVGDKFNSAKGINFTCTSKDSKGIYSDGKWEEDYHNPESYYKVIGEISPEATWIKEGDEFDENEVELWEKLKNHKWTLEDVKKYEGLMGKIINSEKYFNVKIKCPTCSHFH